MKKSSGGSGGWGKGGSGGGGWKKDSGDKDKKKQQSENYSSWKKSVDKKPTMFSGRKQESSSHDASSGGFTSWKSSPVDFGSFPRYSDSPFGSSTRYDNSERHGYSPFVSSSRPFSAGSGTPYHTSASATSMSRTSVGSFSSPGQIDQSSSGSTISAGRGPSDSMSTSSITNSCSSSDNARPLPLMPPFPSTKPSPDSKRRHHKSNRPAHNPKKYDTSTSEDGSPDLKVPRSGATPSESSDQDDSDHHRDARGRNKY